MVLVSQPTHPAFYKDDARHHVCNVCKASFTCPPPTRHELMESFTGFEIAALIGAGSLIGSNDVFDAELVQQMAGMPLAHRRASGYEHWIGGSFLITSVAKDDGRLQLPVREQATLQALKHVLLASNGGGSGGAATVAGGGGPLEAPMTLELRGDLLRVVAGGSLSAAASARASDGGGDPAGTQGGGSLRAALSRLSCVPCVLCLEPAAAGASGGPPPADRGHIGNDHVVAVNLTRKVDPASPSFFSSSLTAAGMGRVVEEARMAAAER
jgi:hypothetical protein